MCIHAYKHVYLGEYTHTHKHTHTHDPTECNSYFSGCMGSVWGNMHIPACRLSHSEHTKPHVEE